MPPHNAYILLEPDTYYFRPYNQVHLGQQAIMVKKWGGDPRHPYANAIFDRVYADWEAEKAKPEVVPVPDATETPVNQIPNNQHNPVVPPENQPQDVPPEPSDSDIRNPLRDDTDNGRDSQGAQPGN
jgi:hypothetical protein